MGELSPVSANPLRDRGASSPSLREGWRASLSTDPDPAGGFIRGKKVAYYTPWIFAPLYMGMSWSRSAGGSVTGSRVGSKRLSMAAASWKPTSLELKLL